MRDPGQTLTRTQISQHVWENSFCTGTNVIDVYVGYLRRKIDGTLSSLIQTVRGLGYRMGGGGTSTMRSDARRVPAPAPDAALFSSDGPWCSWCWGLFVYAGVRQILLAQVDLSLERALRVATRKTW